jgi:hypothetical protein
MQAAGTALDNLLKEIKTEAAQQGEPLKGKTRDRDTLMRAAADATLIAARLVLGHALEHGPADLVEHCSVSASDLTKGRLNRRIQEMRQVHSAISGALPQLGGTDVTPELLTELNTKIDAAEAIANAPRASVVTRRATTQTLERACRRLERLLRYRLDPLMEQLRDKDPGAYALYEAARVVINRPGEPAAPAGAKPAGAPSIPSA